MTLSQDQDYMRIALNMARRGLGIVAPNPSVGCVIVKNDQIIARAHTARGGRPHAEVIALNISGQNARGASAYVTLEPCSHTGQTGPCAQSLIESGIRRVIIACTDPDPRVSGRGIAMLKEAGVDVIEGVMEAEAIALNAGFISRITQNRPFVTLKLGVSQNNKIAAGAGERTQISGPLSGRFMHLQRSRHDAILVGSETYLVDKPNLKARIEGFDHDIKRYVLDRRGRIESVEGFDILRHDNIADALCHIAEQGVTRLLVEGGVPLHEAFLIAWVVDEFQLCITPKELPKNGVNGILRAQITAAGLKLQKTRHLGEDLLEIYTRSH